MERIERRADLRLKLTSLRQDDRGGRIAFVPTMGNLHEGHLALMRQARTLADHVVASIFVNPLQFNNPDDFASYPSTMDEDCAKLQAEGVDVVFTPQVDDMYPSGMEDGVKVSVPGLSDILCGEYRPGHFEGVATVVTRLFNMVQPDVAVFGEKDYQQLLVIRRLVEDLAMPIEIVSGETVREKDGLAMSSRNGYLTPQERQQAAGLYQILCRARDQLLSQPVSAEYISNIEHECRIGLEKAGFRAEYCTVRKRSNLLPPEHTGQVAHEGLIILAAVWLGKARLIDNLAI